MTTLHLQKKKLWQEINFLKTFISEKEEELKKVEEEIEEQKFEARKPNFNLVNKKEVVACFNTRNQHFKATHVEIELREGSTWKHVKRVSELPRKEVITLRLMYWPSDQGIRHTTPIEIFIKEDKSFRVEG